YATMSYPPRALYVSGKHIYIGGGNGNGFLSVYKIPHIEAPAGNFGALAVSDLQIYDNLQLANNFIVNGGINAGGDVYFQDDFSVLGESYFGLNVGIGTSAPSVLLTVGSTTPTHVTGYRDTFLAGDLEVDGLFYVDGPSGTSTIVSNLDITGALAVGASGFYVDSSGDVKSGTWQGDLIDVAYGGTNWNSTGVTGLAFISTGSWGSTSTLSIVYGGTGTSTPPDYGYMLIGNALGGWDYVASSTLGGAGGSGTVGD
ncbi:unnamed protein product, partial [marine sediment metagenome]